MRRRKHGFKSATKFYKVGFGFIFAKARFPVEKHEDESGLGNKEKSYRITVATRASSSRFQSSANEIKNLSTAYQTFFLLEQKVQQACQTYQTSVTCRFRNFESIKHKFRAFQVYRFQNWHQGNIPINLGSCCVISYFLMMKHSLLRHAK